MYGTYISLSPSLPKLRNAQTQPTLTFSSSFRSVASAAAPPPASSPSSLGAFSAVSKKDTAKATSGRVLISASCLLLSMATICPASPACPLARADLAASLVIVWEWL